MIGALEGDWSDEHYHNFIQPLLSAHIKTFHQQALPITRLYDNQFWSSLSADIFVLDDRSWFLKQDEFYDYASRVSSIKNGAIVLFEDIRNNVFDDAASFRNLLNSRTQLLSRLIRSQSSAKIISPAIRIFDYETERRYLEYFINNRKCFDIYAVHCCEEMNDRNIGVLCSILNQSMKLYPKSVWVTKWSIPSCDYEIHNAVWNDRIDTQTAAKQMKNAFRDINNVSIAGSEWFYMGTCKDVYVPDGDPRDALLPYYPARKSLQWNKEHFLGSVDFRGNIKQHIIDCLIELSNA